MGKKDFFELFYTNSISLDVKALLINLLAGLAIGACIYIVYLLTYRGVAYNGRFNASLVLLVLISEVIMIMISSNIVISLGMVGALSIVRFRTAIKDSRDTVFIFWAIIEGLCVGSQNCELAFIAVLVIGIVIILFAFIPQKKDKYLLILRGGEQLIDMDSLKKVLDNCSKQNRLRSVNGDETHQEMIYELRMKKEPDAGFVTAVRNVKGITGINWVSETDNHVG